MSFNAKMPPPIAICGAAVVVNLIGSFVARNLNLPLYLDTGGTIFVAMLSGYVPGVVVGFATNLLNSLLDESEMYYCSISIAVALYTTFLARRKWFRSFLRTLAAIPPLALIAALATTTIEKFLTCTGVVEALAGIQTDFATTFLRELVDKGALVLIMFVALKFIPPQIVELFRGLGQRQAPLTGDMKRAVYERKCPISSLRTKMILILTLGAIFIAASISLITYRIFEQAAFLAQVKVADSLTAIVANEIDPARVDEFISRGHAAQGYDAVYQKIIDIKGSNSDIKFLHACRIMADGCRVVFNPDAAAGTIVKLADDYPHLDDLIAGKDVPPTISVFNGEQLITIFRPVRDVSGNCECYVVIDFSTSLISEYGRTFIAKVLALFSGCFVFIFVLGIRFVENNIILPVNTMDYCTRGFSYDTDAVCANNVEQLKRLKIHTGDEIENLYHALLKTTQDVLDYLEKLRRARRQVAEMDELAHRDSLTGLRNKAAYDEMTAELDKKISDGSATFCIVMIDVNFLKRVNDTYGHERGNEYLINAVKLICAVFGTEHVYRIGGDEFVAILTDDKVSLCKYFVTQFVAEMGRKNSAGSLQPWERVSAAVGAAHFEAGVDTNAESVFKRADAQMYENKLAMKAARTD